MVLVFSILYVFCSLCEYSLLLALETDVVVFFEYSLKSCSAAVVVASAARNVASYLGASCATFSVAILVAILGLYAKPLYLFVRHVGL